MNTAGLQKFITGSWEEESVQEGPPCPFSTLSTHSCVIHFKVLPREVPGYAIRLPVERQGLTALPRPGMGLEKGKTGVVGKQRDHQEGCRRVRVGPGESEEA